ncbi:MAG: TadE/TadG family type IV pilus assembly protein [Micropruina sp.]|uniref:TadE/TadG family type IV pilus assembly protein n=1 Tax=Micropruina sp. TaxID=2737536 RepID=UPI0039E5E65A
MNRRGSERGAAAVEFVVIVPALGLLIAMTIGAARIWHGHTIVEQIAGTSARAASLARTPAQARSDGERIARDQASTRGLNCTALNVEVDVTGFQVPVGQPAQVRTRVSCTVPLSDLIVPGWPGSWQVQAEAGSVLDRYRRRG